MSRAIIARHDNYLNTVSDEMCLAELERHINQFRNHSAERLDREIGRYRRGLRCCSEEGRLAYMRKQSEIWAEELRGCRYIRIIADEHGIDGFFDELFDCVGGRYSVRSVRLLARSMMLNRELITEDEVNEMLLCWSMLDAVQMDIEEERCSTDARLREITEFDAFAVLDWVDRVMEFATVDAERMRGMWKRIMLENERLKRNVGREIKLCFGEKGNDFNKKFVAGVIGVMRNRGYYEGNMKAMSRALEDNRTKQETAYRYMTNGIKGLHIVDGGVRIIDEIVGRRR